MSKDWSDLKMRLISAAVMIIIGVAAIWLGGIWFAILAAGLAGVMVWELARMVGAEDWEALLLAAFGVVASLSILLVGEPGLLGWGKPILIFTMAAPAIAGAVILKEHRRRFAVYALAIVMTAAALTMFRILFGAYAVILLVSLVVVTDVAGYFVGRFVGGPKFWPSISPKKTWSGILAGWAGAGLLMLIAGGSGKAFALGVVLAFASQLGDIAESAIKRRMGVKDSSDLIPGHGGVMDRFDGLAGATLLAVLLLVVVGLPMHYL